MELHLKIIFALTMALIVNGAAAARVNLCFNKTTQPIPRNHLFWKKEKPLIIGHRGQPKVFQENTLEGVKSLIPLGADGFEIDIYLTKDKQLVVFHDDNTQKLTGEDHLIWNLTLNEVKKLTLKKSIKYGKRTYTYPNALKIPTLEEILLAVKDSDLFMYLEMKPSHNPRWDQEDTQRSIDTGRAVAKMVTKLGLESKAFLVSFDPVKPWAAKQENPNLIVGTFFEKDDWQKSAADYMKLKQQYMKQLPNLECLKLLPINRNLADFLFESGSIFKAINASFVDMDYTIYDNPIYTNQTFRTLRQNYNKVISLGGWTLYNMKLDLQELMDTEPQVSRLVSQGIERLITDDVPRMRKTLGRVSSAVNLSASPYSLVLLFAVMINL